MSAIEALKSASKLNPIRAKNRLPVAITLGLIVVLALLAAYALRLVEKSHEQHALMMETEYLSSKKAVLESRLNQLLHLPSAISAHLSADHNNDSAYFAKLSESMIRQLPIFRNISIAPQNIIRHVYPLAGNEKALGFNYMSHPVQRVDVLRAIKLKHTIITGPIKLVQGGRAFIVRSPVFRTQPNGSESYWGMVSMVLDDNALLHEIQEDVRSKDFAIAIRAPKPNHSAYHTFYGDSTLFKSGNPVMNIVLPGGDTWQISTHLQSEEQKNNLTAVKLGIYSLVGLISLLIYIMLVNHFNLIRLHKEKDILVKKLSDSNQTQHRMYSIIAHDLRSPFNALMTTIQLLADDNIDLSYEEEKNFLKELLRYASSFDALAHNLLNWTRSQNNTIAFAPKHQNLVPLLHETMLLFTPQINQKHLQIDTQYETELHAYFDKNMTYTILRNLVSNALKFTPRHGKIGIKAHKTENAIRICVFDTGLGIPKEKQVYIFSEEANYSSNLGTDGERGSGLGLNLCKEFTQRQQGSIWYETETNVGTSFYFTLPLKPFDSN